MSDANNSSFGARLRLQRERQQISLDAIAADTKIKVSLLKGLERNDVSYWPQGIFRRAYIRAYAQAIGLEPDAVVREFLELYPDSVEVLPAGSVAWPDRNRESGGPQPATRLRRLVTSAMAAVPAFLESVQSGDTGTTRPPGAGRVVSAEDTLVHSETEPSGGAADDPLLTFESAEPEPPADVEMAEQESGDATGARDDPPVEGDAPPVERDVPPGAGDPVLPEPDLAAAARLCTRLAQVQSKSEMAPLLEAAATTLDAAGLVVWSWDGRAGALRPVLAHGYNDAVLARMLLVPADGANAVAAAYRSAETCVVNGGDDLLGAVVVPMMAPGGCTGVLALELRHGSEQRDSVCAFAAILAAQLATRFGPAPLGEAANG